ncbi:MAG TPA: tRNA uridine-5-carboxymethylaminomethyl(34) synthesis GTPase MnmE [Solimonas sp.]|nr:tRNA uridine-5-carboxymethylaminomethyl(34) synthesis GTPase MnmE [Solimonas sp.]
MSAARTTDTIVAIASAPGRGGVGIVRISGPDAAAIATRIAGTLPRARHAALREFRDASGTTIDSGLVLHFPAPHSFTGEHVVELQGHGSPVALDLLVRAACAFGARLARAGEFSERAFLNGRLDLTQAEAIADLIEASTAEAARAAQRSLEGELSKRVHALAEQLIELRMYVEGALDFSDEDVDWLADPALTARLQRAQHDLAQLLRDAEQGRRLRDGFVVALTGRPNVGKSTLLNRLAGADVAIVTDIAGTTRDVLRENLNLRGLPVTVVDTAGLHDGGDAIEREGMRRARVALEHAELAIFIVDARTGIGDDDRRLLAELPCELPRLVVHNKTDLLAAPPVAAAVDELHLSAATGAGVDALIDELHRRAGLQSGEAHPFSARTRHVDALQRAATRLTAAAERLHAAGLPELAAEEFKTALDALGEITGEFSSEDLLGRIFASFCIGK